MADPQIEKIAELVSPDGKTTRLLAYWSDMKMTECDREIEHGEEEIECRRTFDDQVRDIVFYGTVKYLESHGWKGKILYDSNPSGIKEIEV